MSDRLFLSCVSSEFEHLHDKTTGGNSARFPGFRSALAGYLRRAGCDVKVQEDFRQTADLDTVEKLADYIRSCRAVVQILGCEQGSTANPTARIRMLANTALLGGKSFLATSPALANELGDCSDLTYTQWEAFLALHYDVDLFIYADPTGNEANTPHLNRLRIARKFPESFASDVDLLGRLVGDLRTIVPEMAKLKQQIAKTRIFDHSAEHFIGREDELQFLDDVWIQGVNVLSLIAWGGEGKTSLACDWIQNRFVDREWQDPNGPAVWRYFDWSFYDQGSGTLDGEVTDRIGSVGDFFDKALEFFGDPAPSAPRDKGRRLLDLIRRQHSLVILDGLEPIQSPPSATRPGKILDPDLSDLVVGLAQFNPGLCVVTSRQPIRDIDGVGGRGSVVKNLRELNRETSIRLLRGMNVNGTDEELAHACEQFGCHALSLTLLGRYICDAHGGDVATIDRINLQKADQLTRPDRHRTVWRVLEAYEQWLSMSDTDPTLLAILRLVGLFDRPATAACLDSLRTSDPIPGLTASICHLDDEAWRVWLKRLERTRLIHLRPSKGRSRDFDVYAHPLVREYFANRLRYQRQDAFRQAHSRIFDYLRNATEDYPNGIERLQPLYQAIYHGCSANRHQEAFSDIWVSRILRGENYPMQKLGAAAIDLAGVAPFFTEPWHHVVAEISLANRGWLQNEVAFRLRACGRLQESLTVLEAGLLILKRLQDRRNISVAYCHLCDVRLLLGKPDSAITAGKKAIRLADKTGYPPSRVLSRINTARASAVLHEVQRSIEFNDSADISAAVLFETAEAHQQRMDCYPTLHSLQGHYYHCFMLSAAERLAWRIVLLKLWQSNQQRRTDEPDLQDCFDSSQAMTELSLARQSIENVKARLRQIATWRDRRDWVDSGNPGLSIAQDVLTRVRSDLYSRLLSLETEMADSDSVAELELSLNGIRKAGDVQFIVEGLLTAAFARFVEGAPEVALTHIDEAIFRAERSDMLLHVADAYLTRARLFGGCGDTRWANAGLAGPNPPLTASFDPEHDLSRARHIIAECHYNSRRQELLDAEAAILSPESFAGYIRQAFHADPRQRSYAHQLGGSGDAESERRIRAKRNPQSKLKTAKAKKKKERKQKRKSKRKNT